MKIKKIISLLFSRLVIFHIIPFKRRGYITCAGKTDGLGAQAQAIYSAMLYSHVNGMPYCHTPLHEIAHNYDNNLYFNEEAEHFFGFSEGERNITQLKNHTIVNLDEISLHSITKTLGYLFHSDAKVIFQKSHYHNYTDGIASTYSEIRQVLKKKYYTNPKTNPFDEQKKCLQIAYHIRRGDVGNTDALRYTGNAQIYQSIQQLKAMLERLNIPSVISICSQGKPEDFGNLCEMAELHLNGNIFDDFNRLVQSDILFMAKSSFSYCAGLLSEGIVVYEPFWHQPLREWHVAGKNFRITDMPKTHIQELYSKK